MPPKAPPYKIKGVIEYFVSPNEQKLFEDLTDVKLLMTKARRKVADNLPGMLPGLVVFFGCYFGGNYLYDQKIKSARW
eukprot:jgi/Galph1/4322/GphlegSOOS_G3002.1